MSQGSDAPTAPVDAPWVGAAMRIDEVAAHRDWLFDGPRPLELQDFVEAETLLGDWREKADLVTATLAGREGPLGVHGPFWGFTIDSQDPEVRTVVQRRMLTCLEICETIGATQMVVHSPFTTWDYHNHPNDPRAVEKLVERCHETMGAVVTRAEQVGVQLVIENIEDIDPSSRVALAASFGSPAVAVSIDTGHAFYAHKSTGAPPVDYYALAAGERLAHIHLQDADGYADRHWALGVGEINWTSLFGALAVTGARPRLIIELRDKRGAPASAAHLRRLGLVR